MKPFRLEGTWERTMYKLLLSIDATKAERGVWVHEGRVRTFHRSAHNSTTGRAYNKLIRLRHGRPMAINHDL